MGTDEGTKVGVPLDTEDTPTGTQGIGTGEENRATGGDRGSSATEGVGGCRDETAGTVRGDDITGGRGRPRRRGQSGQGNWKIESRSTNRGVKRPLVETSLRLLT